MSDLAVKVENLGKLYRIGARREQYATLRGALTAGLKRLVSRPAAEARASETFWALKDVSFEIKQGEVVGIIGRNGAGKSTLLKILAHITEPTQGRVSLYGRVGSLLEVGTGFHPELTGRDNIYLNGAILGMRKAEIERKFDEIVDFAEVEKFLETPVKRYSSGMYVRLAFAVAAYLQPEILLVDEVLAVGDAEFQKKCLGKMGTVAQEGRTVLFVSHNMNAVEQLCGSCLLLDQGVLALSSDDIRDAIRTYMFGNDGGANSVTEWINSGNAYQNSWFTPRRFYVCDVYGNKCRQPLSNNDQMWVRIEGDVDILDPALTIGYAIYSEDGNLLYWSYHVDGQKENWPELKKGLNVIMGQIPSRFLNEGSYRLELIGSLHFRQWLFEPGKNAPSVYVSIQGNLSDSPLWIAKRPGLLAPVLKWKRIKPN